MADSKAACLPKTVVIIGGSLSALMHGIMFHRLGWHVTILEQSARDTPESHMAGVCAAADVLAFFDRFDGRKAVPLGIPSECLQTVDAKEKVHVFLRVPRMMSSWDALYFRLRANFDGMPSAYFPRGGDESAEGGGGVEEGGGGAAARAAAGYEVGKKVVGVDVEGEEVNDRVRVRYRDAKTGEDEERWADLVVGADGANSVVKDMFLPAGVAPRKYAGYVAWRGVVAEDAVSKETRKMFARNITYFVVEGGHVIVYNIPGELGSVEPGKRLLNFCWYSNEDATRLEDIMTDGDGHRHSISVGPAKVRTQVWEHQRELARRLFIRPYREVIEKIASPFVHMIMDYCCPRASFANGKVLLVGDAMTLLRPHIAFSTNQAAYHCMLVERLLKGEVSLDEWEREMTSFMYVHWCRSNWYGDYFQRPLRESVFTAMRYWTAAARYWLVRKEPGRQ